MSDIAIPPDEYDAAIAAAKAAISETVPGWEQGLIPEVAITQMVGVVLQAAAEARNARLAVAANIPHTAPVSWTPPAIPGGLTSEEYMAKANPGPTSGTTNEST